MEKIIVADDEQYSRKALSKMLGKTGLVEVCFEAETGTEVVEYLKENHADILLTDIRMPEMDGLELIKIVSEKYKNMQIIIISGYADFEYAQTAMKYGVREYLTKPTNRNELNSALQHTLQRLEEKRQEEKIHLKKAVVRYLKFIDVLNQAHLSRIVSGIEDDAMSYQIMIFQTKKSEKLGTVETLLLNYGEWNPISVSLFVCSSEVVVFVKAESEIERKHNEVVANKIIQDGVKMGLSIYAAGSGICLGVSCLPQVYEDLVDAMNGRLGENKCRYYSSINRKQAELIFFPKLDSQRILEAIGNYQFERAWEPIDRFLNQIQGPGQQVNLYLGLQEIFLSINQAYQARLGNGSAQAVMRKFSFLAQPTNLYRFRTLDEIRLYICDTLEELCKREPSAHTDNSRVEQIKAYVDEHYQEEITLNEIAQEHFFMNPSYLSRLFRNCVGTSFSKYLTEVRMNHAKELLRYSNFRITDIAGYVGYNDSSYFTQTFKRMMGMTPEQYRMDKENAS